MEANGSALFETKTEDGTEVYENEVLQYLDEYIISHDIDDMSKISQSRWNSALIYMGRSCFYGPLKDKLKTKTKVDNGSRLVNGNLTNCGRYDLNIINRLCDLYIYMCYEFDKEVSILGFSKLTGINPDTFYDWGNGSTRANSSASEIYKKLTQEREESLSNKLVSNRGNALGLLGVLNRHYGWNMGQPKQNLAQQKQRDTAQIAADYGIPIEDKSQEPNI